MFMFFLWMKLNNVLSISGPMSHKQYIELHEDSPGISLCTYCTSDEPLTDCYPRDAVTDDNHLKSKHKHAIQCQHCNSDYLLREGPFHSPLLTLKYQSNLNQPITTRRSLIHYLTLKLPLHLAFTGPYYQFLQTILVDSLRNIIQCQRPVFRPDDTEFWYFCIWLMVLKNSLEIKQVQKVRRYIDMKQIDIL